MRDIGRVPLLSHEQEITLGRQVQEYMQVERAELEIIDLTGDKPSIDELSNKLNLSTSIIKKRLRAGQRAKERMVAAKVVMDIKLIPTAEAIKGPSPCHQAKGNTTSIIKIPKRNSITSCIYSSTYRYWGKCWCSKLNLK